VARKVTRSRVRRGALDRAYDRALQELPAELQPMVISYAANMAEGQRLRSELSTMMTRHRVRWFDVDQAASRLSVG
jgi:uncharacterized sporulation protein YeaH/YhbH (DUF444 family)